MTGSNFGKMHMYGYAYMSISQQAIYDL